MLRIKNKLAKRILAFVLSGAMVVSGMTTSGMTAFAEEASTEAPEDTSTYSGEEEAAEEQQNDDAQADVDDNSIVESDEDDTDKDDSDKDDLNKDDSDKESALDKESLNEESSNEDDKKDPESSTGDAEDEMTASDDAEEEEETQGTDVDNKADGKPTVWMVGDSTMCSYLKSDGSHSEAHLYYPRYGYGTQLYNYLDDTYEVNNLAMSGKSSKSFLTEANYTTLKEGIQSGDILIIGWGHNDEKTGNDTYTAPNGTSTTEGSFAKSLYDNYIKLANDKGAQPILCTPIVRRDSSGNYTGEKIHQANGGDYAQDIINLGKEVNVPVVDLTTLTKELYMEVGVEETLNFHSWSTENSASVDNTHLNIYGAKKVAYMLAKAIKEEHSDLDIASHVNIATEPTKETDLVKSSGYVKPTYTPPTNDSTIWDTYGIFKGSAFGSLGKAPTKELFTIGKNEDGTMHLKAAGNGKLSATETGVAMYYYRIPSTAIFTFSAKATVNSIDEAVTNPGQAGFGLMARDNMYIDKNDKTLDGDYVVAGTLMDGSANCFYHKAAEAKLEKGKPAVTAPKEGDEYELSIKKNPDGDGYTCKFGDNLEQTGGFDFQLNATDVEYQYIGMFVSRNADITFSDIKLTVDGKEIDIQGTSGDDTPGDDNKDNDLSIEGDGGAVEISTTDGLKTGKTYGYKSIATFEVLENMPFLTESDKHESYAITVDDQEYTGCVQGNSGPSDSHAVQAAGKAAFKITAVTDSKITFITRENAKNLYFVNASDTSDKSQNIASGDRGAEGTGKSYPFKMTAGNTYYFYAGGSKVMVAAISIEKADEGSSEPGTGEENPSEPGTGEENPSEPGTGEENPSEPGTGEENPSEPGTGEEKPSEPGTGGGNSGDSDSKIPADRNNKTISLSNIDKIKVAAADVVYAKKQPYAITVTYTYTKDGKSYQQQLIEDLHYTVEPGNVDLTSAGSKTVTLKGTKKKTDLGTFTGETTVTYEVLDKRTTDKKDISKEKDISLNSNDIKNLSYTGDYIIPVVQGVDGLGGEANYKIVYKNNVNAGKASATVVGQGEYYGTKVLTYTIKPTDLSKPTEVLKLSASKVEISGSGKAYEATGEALAYKGSPVTLENLTITYAGKKLRPQEDYTITYKVNVQKLVGTATIKGINNFKGSITINYKMTTDSTVTPAALTALTEVPAEYSSKGARLTEIALSNGTILKENVDYKVTYTNESKQASVGDKGLTLEIAGAGAYKTVITKKTPISIEVVKGKYYIKDGTIVDAKKAANEAKLVSAAKIMDASGAKVKPTDVTLGTYTLPLTTITVSPNGEANAAKYETTTLSCRVAEKLSGVKPVGNIKDQPFDGVNSVTLTEKRIENYTGLKASDIRIVSYKNNNKIGSATVTIEGTESGPYYGTRSLKFKISATATSDRNPEDEEGESNSGSGSTENPSESSTGDEGDESNPSESSTGDEGDESNPSESSTGDETNPDEPTPSGKRIDVWDFGGKEETDSATYINNITPDIWKASGIIGHLETGQLGEVKNTDYTYSFEDLTMGYVGSDRLYSNLTSMTGYVVKTASNGSDNAYTDGYTAAGAWYSNGSGKETSRYVTIKNMSAGDKIVAYMGTHTNGPVKYHFDGQDTATSAQKDSESTETTGKEFKKFVFIAKYNGTYKIWPECENSAKPMYHRIMRVPAVNVTGTIDFGPLTSTDGVTLKFVNQTTKDETAATLDGTSFTANLAAGYTYNAVLSGAMGYGFTNDSKVVTTTDSEAVKGKAPISLVVETKSTYTYSGKITGFAENYDKSHLSVTMEADPDSQRDDVALTINDDLSFTATLEPDVTYTIVMKGVNDYEVKSAQTVNQNQAYTADITVGLKDMYDITGAFVDLDGNAVTGVTALVFTNVDDSYTYEATVTDGASYSVSLRDGSYSAAVTIESYETNSHVVVDGAAIEKDLLLVSTVKDGALPWVADLYVGDSSKANNYDTVSEAVKAAKRMMPEKPSDSNRITIHIAPGKYREQIIVDASYITFKNDNPSKEVLLTWYYGIGYLYYSTDANGYYNPENAYDQYEKKPASRWGCAVRVKGDYFKAENITFENSFNRYITDEEIADGVELSPSSENTHTARNYNTDVTSKAATERAAAMAIDADCAEFYQCAFYSSQDTIVTSATAYFKNCVIEGQTDYICGGGNCVFDACELSWKGYSTGSQGGYITAAQTGAGGLGYLFRNCTVTANNYNKLEVKPGDFGRPWSENAKVIFMNTKLQKADLITDAGWTNMNNNTAAKADFTEYNTTALDGGTINYGELRTSKKKDTIPVSDVTTYFGGWKPSHYVAEAAGDVVISGNVTVTDNADINTPKAGNTLTVHYSLGNYDEFDASIIKWYTVEKNDDGSEKTGTEKLVKSSTASAGKTYKIATADNAVGKYIKVTVTPQTIGGKIGEAKSYTLENPVAEGYEDPSSGGDITLGEGINIFLAGDSTVKDYSANGMYNKGSALNEGSWGEFIQSFFDKSQVTIQNYAQGGRSSRTLINDGMLKKIEENMSEGDYLFIQFGHNDCADKSPDRYVPLGEPDENGIYPVTAGTPNEDGKYPDDGEGTYKWFLKQYIDAAKRKGGIPVLVTPVARMNYNSDGTIQPKHDKESLPSEDKKNTYVTAMKQLAAEEEVLLIDGYELTEDLFEAAWKADGNNNDTYGKQIMNTGEKTHNNKLGGMIEAAVIATAIQDLDLNISYAVKAPTQVLGETMDGTTVFSVNGNGVLTAYDILNNYSTKATYWEGVGQKMFDDITEKAKKF